MVVPSAFSGGPISRLIGHEAWETPLSKTRLHALLAMFEDGVGIDMVGGIDTGVYFSFKGKASVPIDPEQRIQHGRIVSRFGFCSEDIVPTRHEFFQGAKGQARFFQRCEDRLERLQRWTDAYYARSRNEPLPPSPVPDA